MLNRALDDELYGSYSDDIPTFLKRIYAARAVSETELDLSISNLLQPDFAQLPQALTLLEVAIKTDKRILIIGDFDCDGATASTVAIKSLRLMGAKYVDFLVPNRFKHGYGLSPEIVKLAIKDKQPEVIITVDNGISSVAGAALCKKHKISLIITDHHLPPENLPEADAIINPNLKDCTFKSKNLAGVGVCFYLFSALKTHLQQQNYFVTNKIQPPDLRNLLDLVALGTVADVVLLDQNNRILVKEGIKRIRCGNCAVGILALLEVAGKNKDNLQAESLGFAVAPRINAAGRLADISRGIRCLLSDDWSDARRYAAELNNFNQKRRSKQDKMQAEADAIIQKQDKKSAHFAISLFDEAWHEGIVGIVAGKLKQEYHCPAAVFARSGEMLKGSIRSIPAVHIKDLLDLVDRKNPDLIDKFGGHAMAAGLSIKPDNFAKFKSAFAKAIKMHLKNQAPTAEIFTDGELVETEISIQNAELIQASSPWGQGFDEPIFQGKFELIEQTVLKEKHLKLQLKSGSTHFNAIAFFHPPITTKTPTIAYKLSINEWRGTSNLQLIIEAIKTK